MNACLNLISEQSAKVYFYVTDLRFTNISVAVVVAAVTVIVSISTVIVSVISVKESVKSVKKAWGQQGHSHRPRFLNVFRPTVSTKL